MSQESAILRLPQEVLMELVAYLLPRHYAKGAKRSVASANASELLILRSTCNELLSRTEQVVAETYFSHLRCNITEKAELETLLDVSRHATFSKVVKDITFCFAKMHDLQDDSSAETKECLSSQSVVLTEEDKCDYRNIRCEYAVYQPEKLEACEQALISQNRLLSRGGDSGMLHMTLSNFKASGNVPALRAGVEGHYEACGRPFELKAFKHDKTLAEVAFQCGYWLFLNERDHRPFEIISEAIRNTAYPVTSLEVGSEYTGVPLRSEEFIFRDCPSTNLKILKIRLDATLGSLDQGATQDDSRVRAGKSAFVTFLTECRNLETLAIGFYNTDDWEVSYKSSLWTFCAIAEALTTPDRESAALPKIRQLALKSGSRYHLKDLLAIVRATQATLRCLQLGPGALYDMQTIGPITGTIAEAIKKAHGGQDFEVNCYEWEEDERI